MNLNELVKKTLEPFLGICDDEYTRMLKLLEPKYRWLGKGAFRSTFQVSPRWVLKFPRLLSISCFESNIIEYLAYNYSQDLPLAKCELFYYNKLPVIVMERVRNCGLAIPYTRDNPIGDDGKRQFGFKYGKPTIKICYDYGNEEQLFPALNDTVVNNVLNRPNLSDNIPEYLKSNPIRRKNLWE